MFQTNKFKTVSAYHCNATHRLNHTRTNPWPTCAISYCFVCLFYHTFAT